jgi:NodT family efflux transporter outer membrane factor (OMF) lipoprotein
MKRRVAVVGACCAVAALAGCATPGPRIAPPSPVDASMLAGVGGVAAVSVDARWWTRLGDPQLDALVDEALRGSPGVAAAAARVARAQAVALAAGAALEPQATAGARASRQRLSERDLVPPQAAGRTLNQGRLAVDLGYELDAFGRARATRAAALGQAAAAEHELAAARLALASAVARTYVHYDRTHRQLAIARESLAQRTAMLALTEQRVRAGLDTQVEVETARGGVAQAESELAQLTEQLDLVRNQLAALAGAGPGRGAELREPALALGALPAVPDTLPAELVARRPDVAARRALVTAAGAEVRAARAQFYPNVNLAAFAGFQSIELGNLVGGGTRVWGVAPAVNLPLFDGGQLRGNLRARDADYAAAVAAYDDAVLGAFREVADAVGSLRALDREQAASHAALASLERAYELAMLRYRSGLANFLTVLVAQDRVLAQRRATVELDSRRAELAVNLYRALGGGFDARPDATERLE